MVHIIPRSLSIGSLYLHAAPGNTAANVEEATVAQELDGAEDAQSGAEGSKGGGAALEEPEADCAASPRSEDEQTEDKSAGKDTDCPAAPNEESGRLCLILVSALIFCFHTLFPIPLHPDAFASFPFP